MKDVFFVTHLESLTTVVRFRMERFLCGLIHKTRGKLIASQEIFSCFVFLIVYVGPSDFVVKFLGTFVMNILKCVLRSGFFA